MNFDYLMVDYSWTISNITHFVWWNFLVKVVHIVLWHILTPFSPLSHVIHTYILLAKCSFLRKFFEANAMFQNDFTLWCRRFLYLFIFNLRQVKLSLSPPRKKKIKKKIYMIRSILIKRGKWKSEILSKITQKDSPNTYLNCSYEFF